MRHRLAGLSASVTVSFTLAAFVVIAAAPSHAAFPGANGKIAFQSFRDGNHEIYVMNPDGSDPVRLTSTTPFDGAPAWSADGTRIVFASVFGIQVMNADGSGRFSVTTNPFDSEPTWSPDGAKIAFTSDDAESANIHVVNLDGSGEVSITDDSADDFNPAWSPDGAKIAFTKLSFDGVSFHYDIYAMNPDGSGQTNITNKGGFDREPDWSPDGSKIAFAGFGVEVINADGSGRTRLMTSSAGQPRQPAWSPDGYEIAFTRAEDRFGSDEVLVMNADGSEVRRLTTSPGFDGEPSWQPILFPGHAPDCSAVAATPDVLLPPARDTFRLVRLSGAVDADGDPLTYAITRVTQDEPVTGTGDDTSPDARRVPAADELELRPERRPMGDGRVYRIRYTVFDGTGAYCRGVELVSVPRHRDQPAVDSAPPSFDSFEP
jgi:Tol biopolymer transport system component